MRCLPLFLSLACGGSAATSAPVSEPQPGRADSAAISCDTLKPCRPDLGVCLRCTTPDNPEWVWSEAPGSPHLLTLPPEHVGVPDMDADGCCGVEPFHDHHVPDCRRFVFDERGMPLETRQMPGEAERLYRFTYDDGRVVLREQDLVPFCQYDDFGDRRACGEPDGTFDEATPYMWSADGRRMTTENGHERVFDDEGHLVRWRGHEDTGHHTYENGHVVERRQDFGDRVIVDRFRYTDGRLVRREVFIDGEHHHTSRSFYDEHGWLVRLERPVGSEVYENEYVDGRLVRRTTRRIDPNGENTPTTIERRHDEHGLVVMEREESRMHSVVSRWERNEQGVPIAYVRHQTRFDQSCLEPLARYFVR